MDDSLFRKVSLERLSSPEQIDQLMKIRSPSGWLALSASFILLLIGCLWLIFGKIPVTVPCDGKIMPVTGLAEVQSMQTVAVDKVCVSAGDKVQKADVLVKGTIPETGELFLIKSPINGVITDIYVNEGSVAMQGEALVRVEPYSEDVASGLCAIMNISINDSVRLRGGEKAFFSPAGISLDRYGYIKGAVESIGRYPEGNQQDVEVRISFLTDENGNIEYTYGRVPQELPYGGTPCSGYILLGYKSPAEMVLPWLAEKD